MPDNKQHYHDKGEADAQNRDYNPPHGLFDSLTTWSERGSERNSEENDAYNKGYENGKEQRE
jgi:hypothetical protein